LISGYVRDIFLVRKGLAARSLEERLDKDLKENFDSAETIRQLYELELFMATR
jgi:hypothetical protein